MGSPEPPAAGRNPASRSLGLARLPGRHSGLTDRDQRQRVSATRPGPPPRFSLPTAASALQVREDLASGVLPRLPGDPAAGMRARATEIEAVDGEPVPGAAEERPPQEPLVERLLAVERVAAREAIVTLEVERRDHLAGDDARGEARGEVVEHGDGAIG